MTIWEVDEAKDAVAGLDEDGRPDPAYAAALGLIQAPIGRRAAAFAIDAGVYVLLQLPFWLLAAPLLLKWQTGRISRYGLLNHPSFTIALVGAAATFLFSLVYFIVQAVVQGRRGATLGKSFMGLRTVNVKTLERPGFFKILLRFIVVASAGIVPFGSLAFWISSRFDPSKRGRGWHDKVADTWLIDIRAGLDPYDAKRMRVARKAVTTAPIAAPMALPSLATSDHRGDEPVYRPGARVSAGVLGVARPHQAGERSVVGLAAGAPADNALATGSGPAPAAPGRPVVGGYRPREPEAPSGSAAPTPHSSGHAVPHDQSPPVPPSQGAAGSQAPAPVMPRPSVTAPAVPPLASDAPQPWSLRNPPVAQQAAAPAPVAQPGPGPGPAAQPAPVVQPASEPQRPQHAAPAPGLQPAPAPAAQPAAAPPVQQAPHVWAAPVISIALDSGQRITLDVAVVVGRNPVAPGTHPQARAHPLTDDTRSVSKTHALLLPVPGGVEIHDQNSTNGTAVVRGGREVLVAPGRPEVAYLGEAIRFGDRTASLVSA